MRRLLLRSRRCLVFVMVASVQHPLLLLRRRLVALETVALVMVALVRHPPLRLCRSLSLVMTFARRLLLRLHRCLGLETVASVRRPLLLLRHCLALETVALVTVALVRRPLLRLCRRLGLETVVSMRHPLLRPRHCLGFVMALLSLLPLQTLHCLALVRTFNRMAWMDQHKHTTARPASTLVSRTHAVPCVRARPPSRRPSSAHQPMRRNRW